MVRKLSMKKTFFIFFALITMVSLVTTTASAAPTAMQAESGQLKVCKVAGSGVVEGTLFTFRVNGSSYSVPAGPAERNGYCVLAGQYPVNSEVTVEEVIPSGYYVSRIEVKPDRTVSKDTSQGIVTLRIVSGVIEAIFTNKVAGSPTPTRTPTSVNTPTPRPTKTPPSCDPNCTATPTPIPMGRLQICKEAEGSGVTGSFTFRFETRSRNVPVGACAGLIAVNAGTLRITEDARTGFTVADIYTIPADRLINKDLITGVANVRIVEGTAASQTIVIFRNRAVSITPTFTSTPTLTATATATGSQTVTSTATPTESITPTFTPTFTPTSTGTITVCPPESVVADFSRVGVGDPIEGFGVVAPYLNIDAKGTAIMIQSGQEPFQYRATGTGTSIVNGGIDPAGGFGDSRTQQRGQPHRYTFTFAPGVSVNDFSLRMLDFGDLNPTLATNHTVTLRAYNAANQVVGEQVLNYTTTPVRLPPGMQLAGDATGAALGEPGNYPWHVTGTGILKVVLEFGEGYDPNVGFDSLGFTTEDCPICRPFTVTETADFSQVPLGDPIEGFGVVALHLKIDAKGEALMIQPGQEPFQYRATGTGTSIVNGGI